MLKTDVWTYFEGFSKLEDGTTVMKFFGQVNNNNPDDVLVTEKENEEDSYRKNVKEIRHDRRDFENIVYAEADRIRHYLEALANNVKKGVIE